MHAQVRTLPDTALVASTHTLNLRDGTELFYRAWHPGGVPRSRAVILFHGGHEHAGRFEALVEGLDLPDTSVFAWDARGHGRSGGERGHARHFMEFVRDADEFVRHLSASHAIPLESMALLGHSVGSVIAATYVHDYAPPIKALVLGSPAFRVKLYVPAALPALRLWQRVRPGSYVNSYVRPQMLTHDTAEAAARRVDPLISPRIAVPVLTSLFDTAERVIAGAGSIRVPTLLLSAGRDFVVHTEAHRRFYDRLGAERKVMKQFPGFYHEIFHETGRHQATRLARGFILEAFYKPAKTVAPSRPDNGDLFEQVTQPLTALDPHRWGYAMIGAGLRSVGRLSAGVRLGLASGFDSGRTLDYVYANQAHGTTPLGRVLDRAYLDSVGWRGIRQRAVNLNRLLHTAIDGVSARKPEVHVVDIAGGPGRYLQDVLAERRQPGLTAVCRDRDEAGLAQGREAAAARGLNGLRYQPGDAFDPASIATLEPRPDIVVVSGLYELFADNGPVLTSLSALHEQMQPGGYLLITNQPHHPQLAFIARTLVNREGRPWVMRPRSQAELTRLLGAAGFTPERMLTDDAGIFTVTLARRDR